MKHVILTGAGGGIGRYLAHELLLRRGDLWVTAICRGRKPHFTDDTPPRYRIVKCDLADLGDIVDVAYKFGNDPMPVDAVINLAGQTHAAMSWKDDPTDVANLFESNVQSAMNVVRAFAPAMRTQKRGRIINVSSVVAHIGAVGASAYAASKGALEAYTRTLALELAPSGVTANCIALGYMAAGMIEKVPPMVRDDIIKRTPLGRLGEVAELAELVHYLLKPESQFMTGQTLNLNGGLHLG